MIKLVSSLYFLRLTETSEACHWALLHEKPSFSEPFYDLRHVSTGASKIKKLQQTTIKISSMRFKPSRKNIPRYFNGFQYSVVLTKQTFTCSKSTVENLEKEVKYVQS